MTSFKMQLNRYITNNSSRERSRQVRIEINEILKRIDSITINLKGTNLTPSAADEIFGKLASQLGSKAFKEKIKIINISPSNQSLIRHVITRRTFRK